MKKIWKQICHITGTVTELIRKLLSLPGKLNSMTPNYDEEDIQFN